MMHQTQHTVEVVRTELEMDERLELHETGWKIQRWGWALLGLFVLLAGAGLFGDGFLSKRTLEKEGIKLKYERFYRQEAQMELEICHAGSGALTVGFPLAYLEAFKVSEVVPQPASVSFRQGAAHYSFAGSGPATVTFTLIPTRVGSVQGDLRINEQQCKVRHIIFP